MHTLAVLQVMVFIVSPKEQEYTSFPSADAMFSVIIADFEEFVSSDHSKALPLDAEFAAK